MSTPSPSTSKARRLQAEAREAAEIRDALTHPDVVALRVERVRGFVSRMIWTGMVLGLLFTMTNVQQFAAHTEGFGPGSLGWWAAWLLDPTVSVILLGVLFAERETSPHRVLMDHWARVAKWLLLGATYVMNTWESYAAANLAGIVLHTVPVLAVFVGAEAVTSCNDALTRAVEVAVTKATERADRKAREAAERDQQARQTAAEQPTPPPAVVPAPVPVPIAAPPAPAFRTVPTDRPDHRPTDQPTDRPGARSAERTADRPASPTRTGPARKRAGKPKTDAQLSRAVRELTEQNGTPPSQYAIKQRFGVGSGRAARLLAELHDLTPAGAPASNGAAHAEGGTR